MGVGEVRKADCPSPPVAGLEHLLPPLHLLRPALLLPLLPPLPGLLPPEHPGQVAPQPAPALTGA